MVRPHTICVSLLFATLLAGPAASADMAVEGGTLADKVLVLKAQRKLFVIRNNQVLREMDIRLGLVPEGDKQTEGDFKTPEGQYVLDAKNADSDYFLAIHINYPSQRDRQEAAQQDSSPGGNIVIHGLPNELRRNPDYYASVDWTDGCIALSNSDMVDLWRLTIPNTPIEILP